MKANRLATFALGAALALPAMGALAKDKPAFADQLKTAEVTLTDKQRATNEARNLADQVTKQVRTAIEVCHTGNRVNISEVSENKLEPDPSCLVQMRDSDLKQAKSDQERTAINKQFDSKILRAIQNMDVFLDIDLGECDGGTPAGSACAPDIVIDPTADVRKIVNALSSPQLKQQALKDIDSRILEVFLAMAHPAPESHLYTEARLRDEADKYHAFIDRSVTDSQKQKEAHKIVDQVIVKEIERYIYFVKRDYKGKPNAHHITYFRKLYESIQTPEIKKEAERVLAPVVKKAQK